MKVVEKDNVVQGMLDDEYRRCLDVIKALQAKMESYPRGALNIRRKKIKDKEYIYYYLVWREGQDVINRHVAADNLPELQKQIADREQCSVITYIVNDDRLQQIIHNQRFSKATKKYIALSCAAIGFPLHRIGM